VASQIKIKRSSVAGKVPTTSDIATGELAINTKDKKIYSSNGTVVFDFIAPYLEVANAASTYLPKTNPVITGTLTANGSVGTAGYYLRTSGSGIYWSPVSASGGGGGGASWAALTSTNTALRTLISDRYQVANVNVLLNAKATWTALTGTNTAIRTLVSDRLQVANAVATYQTKAVERAALANTNLRINLINTNLTGTNTALRTLINNRLQVANAAATYAPLSNPSITGTITATGIVSGSELTSTLASGDEGGQINLAKPPNATTSGGITIDAYQNKLRIFEQGGSARGVYIDLTAAAGGVGTNLLTGGGGSTTQYLQVANAVATYQTKSVERAALANTNSYIATKASWSALTGTNTAIRTLVSDRYQVANVNTLLAAKATWTGLIGTNTALRLLINDRIQVANALAIGSTKASWTALTGTNTALRTLISDRLQVANASATYQTKSVERAALANTNSYIGTQAARITLVNTNLTGTNTALRTLISDRLQVANAVATYQTKSVERAALANTNLRINLINTNLTGTNTALRTLISDRLQVANAALIYQTKAVERAALANTNSYIGTQASRINLINTNLTSTNTALRLLINDRYQVANVNTLLNAIATWAGLTGTNTALRTLISDRYQVANVNTLLLAKASWVGLTGTNTAIRTLVSDRLQVANAASVYQTKAIERAALANTNLRINLINTNLTGTNTALRTLISDRLQVANASTLYLTKNNPVITGTLTANSSTGTAGYYLRTSGTGIYWSPVSGGGGSAANGFSGILVGANVVSADSTTDRLTLVAGSGITISANPATDTITFTATGGGGSFTGGTISGATTVTDTTASTSNLTGAFKVTGGVGVTGNIYTAGRVGYASNTTSGTSVVYTYYNATTGSLDTVFG